MQFPAVGFVFARGDAVVADTDVGVGGARAGGAEALLREGRELVGGRVGHILEPEGRQHLRRASK